MAKRDVQKLVQNILKDNSIEYKKESYLETKLSFDIETSSIYEYSLASKKIKAQGGFMYIWMVGLNGQCIHGRTWDEFKELIEMIQSTLQSQNKNVICLVHNLSFEFQFIRKLFHFDDLFFSKRRCLLYGRLGHIIFRDSLVYTGKKLVNVAKDLNKYKVEKKVGDLDYKVRRNSKTKLSELEMSYCINDVIILNNFFQEELENYGMSYILDNLTKTSKVRYDMKLNCFFNEDEDGSLSVNKENRKFIRSLKITGDDYRLLRRAYQGGFTHANSIHVNKVFKQVHSVDFTSSYPAVLLAEKYLSSPLKELKNITQEQFYYYINKEDEFDCFFDIEFDRLISKGEGDDIVSLSKIWNMTEKQKREWINDGSLIDNNGRVKQILHPVRLSMNTTDFKCICKFYLFNEVKILKFKYGTKSYLPKWFIEGVLYYYKLKTIYKGVKGKEVEYQAAKEKLNSIYGMLVEDLLHMDGETYDNILNTYKEEEKIEFNGKMVKINSQTIDDKRLDKIVNKYNNSRNRFTFFCWGVECTSYARRNLQRGILALGKNSYYYSDTDSMKFDSYMKHKKFFDEYNKEITEKIGKCLDFYGIPREEAAPRGKQLGVWDWETKPFTDKETGEVIETYYHNFKTLGAKRYVYTQTNTQKYLDDEKTKLNPQYKKIEFHSTIAGLGKSEGAKYISQQKDPFEFFSDGMKIPAENTGKLTHFYIDEPVEMEVEDEQGHKELMKSESCIVLAPCSFEMGLSDSFKDLIDKLDEYEDESEDFSDFISEDLMR